MPKNKIALGLAIYGRCFTLDSMNEHGMLAPAHKPGKPGPFTRVPGSLGYNEVRIFHNFKNHMNLDIVRWQTY